MPITFYIELNAQKPNGQLTNVLHHFSTFYNVLETHRDYIKEIHSNLQLLHNPPKQNKGGSKWPNRIIPTTFDKRGYPQFTRYCMPLCHFTGHNLWLLKPTSLNRGRGIHVFRDLETLKSLITSYYQSGTDEVTQGEGGKEEIVKKNEEGISVNSFIIQKYIESPLLIHRRKFDIRVLGAYHARIRLLFV